ncbi:10573_t:CDS:2 [Paraglomus occultum]|uniref:10573_t:CDS:1 n=1 Tax=Paraglomus occultum TaxID=144539 RepID=A0A9N9AMQ8_9GLOM|nr:10573_t:CDS:2 [Paraglomus occultum]
MSYQYDQYHQQQQQYGGAMDNKTTLWMGELEPWMDEGYIRGLWYQMGEQVNVKFIRDKFTGANAGYCFVDFVSNAAAVKALTTVNGTPIPGTNRMFKLNWASGGGLSDRNRDDRGPEYSIFVGDLGPEVTEWMLVSVFQQRYSSCKSAKIMTDPMTGMSRGYGFVRFADESEQQRALVEMQGLYCGNRPMRISTATPKNKGATNPMQTTATGYYQQPPQNNPNISQYNDPNNTTVFVGGLSGVNSEEELRSYFAGFGEITYVKIPPGKGCGFVQFVHRQSAEMAINQMQHYPIGNSRVRLSWGRSQTDKSSMGAYRPPSQAPPPAYNPLSITPAPSYVYSPSTPVVPPLPTAQSQIPSQVVDPLEPVPVQRMNEMYITKKEGLLERIESDGSSWRGIYAQ